MALKQAVLIQGPRVALVLSAADVDAINEAEGIDGDPNAPAWSDMGDSVGLTWHTGAGEQRFWLVGLSDRLDIAGVVSTLVHESVHVWQEFKSIIGEDNPSREFEAYSIEGIFTELMRQYGESKEGKRKLRGRS